MCVKYGFWNGRFEIWTSFEFFGRYVTPGFVFRAGVIYRPAMILNINWPLALGLKLLLCETATRWQQFSLSYLVTRATEPQWKSPSRLEFRTECDRKKPLKFVSLLLVRVFNLIFYFLLQQVWLQCLACCRYDRCGSFTHIQMSVLPGILFPCTLWQNVVYSSLCIP